MGEYLAPGVYYERSDASAAGIAPLRTDIAGFVGIAPRGPLHVPVPVDSWRQFQAWFGDFTGAAYLAYAVRAFFENGGRRCWVVRVAGEAAAAAQAVLRPDERAAPRWIARAYSPGVWGGELQVTVRETHRAQTRTRPGTGDERTSTVASTSGFRRGTHVRLTQEGRPAQWKVVADIDPVARRLVWVGAAADARLRWERALSGFDTDREITVESVEYTLIVREQGVLRRVYSDLSLVPEHPRYGPALLAGARLPRPGTPALELPLAPEPIVLAEAADLDALAAAGPMLPLSAGAGAPPTEWTLALAGGADGLAALSVADFCGDADPLLDTAARRGLAALYDVGEVALVAVPDIHIRPVETPPPPRLAPCVPDPCLPVEGVPPVEPPPRAVGELPPVFSERDVFLVQAAMVQQCEARRDRVALLDVPHGAANDPRQGIAEASAWRSRFDTAYAALYYPWIEVVDPLRAGGALVRAVPPCGHVAGQCARSDLAVGVHQAPANAPLAWAQGLTAPVDEAGQAILNPRGVNAIRAFPGRGLRVFGARTATSDPALVHLNVRRLLLMIGKAIDVSLQWAVFEPNDHVTRAKIQLALSEFLAGLWRRGALAGATRDEAFFVRCDDTLNPPADRAEGRLVAQVGVAPARPLEFVVIRVGRWGNGFEIMEEGGSALLGG